MKGHLRERSPGHWAIILDVPLFHGKRKRKWHQFTGTKREARTNAPASSPSMRPAATWNRPRTTVAAFLDRWLEHMAVHRSRRARIERYAEIRPQEHRAAARRRSMSDEAAAGADFGGLLQGARQRSAGRQRRAFAAHGRTTCTASCEQA